MLRCSGGSNMRLLVCKLRPFFIRLDPIDKEVGGLCVVMKQP